MQFAFNRFGVRLPKRGAFACAGVDLMSPASKDGDIVLCDGHPSSAAEWHAGWALVLVSLLGYAVSTTHSYTIGVFMPHIESEFGWTRADVSNGVLAYSVVAAMLSPAAGFLIGRFGIRRVGIPGMIAYCLSLALLSCATPSIGLWWGLWSLIGTTSVLVKPTLWGTAVSRQFVRQRGTALAIVLCGSSLCSAVAPSLVNGMIGHYGWRSTYLGAAAVSAVFLVPLMFLLFRNGGGASAGEAGAALPHAEKEGWGVLMGRSILSYRFFAIALPALLMTTAVMGIVVHFVPMLVSTGLESGTATRLTAALGAGSILGRLVTGALLDRIPGHLTGSMAFLLLLIPIALLLSGVHGSAGLALVALLVGFSFGSEMDVTIYLSTRYFDSRTLSTILGSVMGLLMLGNGIGAALAGRIFDATGDYRLFLVAVIPLVLISSILTRTLGPCPRAAAL